MTQRRSDTDAVLEKSRTDSLVRAALDWAAAGVPIFPCHNAPGSDRHKAPLTPSGFKDATTDGAQIEAWWTRFPSALIGMPTGIVSGIDVIDLDKKNGKDGLAAVPDWQQLSPVIVQTGGGGVHLYFGAHGNVRCATGKDGVDIRGEGGYVIVPPSPGYTWLTRNDLSSLPLFPQRYRTIDYVPIPNGEVEAEPAMVAAALRVIPNDDEDHDTWKKMGLAVFAATGGSDEGFDAWDKWSEKSNKYDARYTAKQWEKIRRSPPDKIGAGTIFWMANDANPNWWSRYDAEVDARARQAFAEGAEEFTAQLGLERPSHASAEVGYGSGDRVPRSESQEGVKTPVGPDQADRPVQPKPASALGEWNAADDDWNIPPRQWLLGNVFCRRFVSALIADGGSGKTALRVLQALALATGRPLSGEHVFGRARVLLVSLEDDIDELRRRVRAAMLFHNIKPDEIDGWLFLLADPPGKFVTVHPQTKRPAVAPLKTAVEKVIVERKIDLLIIDPLVKAHDVEENDNTAMDVVVQTFSSMAIERNIAVDLLHHTSKGAADPGNADRGRGASAVKNGARLVYTLTHMAVDEAARFGIEENERRSYVRVDSGKVNITPPLANAQWFKIVGVPLGNSSSDYPNGDHVQTIVAWTPPHVWAGIGDDVLKRILDEIDKGPPDGGRYSNAPKATTRAAWPVVQRNAANKTEKQCRQLIAELLKTKKLIVKEYRDATTDHKTRSGLFLYTQTDADDVPM